MPIVIEEQNLRFEFDDHWEVVKFDDDEFYKKRLMPLQVTKAVDFVALHRGRDLYFIEVKDFRGRRIELKNKEKFCDGDTLFLQVARKVKDSVACVCGASRVTVGENQWRRFATTILKQDRHLKVILWLEFDTPPRKDPRPSASVKQQELKKRLTWLTKQVNLTNLTMFQSNVLPGVTVENIGRVG